MKNVTLLLLCAFGLSVSAQNYKVKYYENRTPINPEKLKTAPASVQEKFIKNHNSYTLNYSNGVSLYKNDVVESPFSLEEIERMNLVHNEEIKKDIEKQVKKEYKNSSTVSVVSFLSDSNSVKEQTVYYKQNNLILAKLNQYDIKDKCFDWNWKITDETKDILGYTCKKATSNLMGYDFVAWFTDEIPVNAGPDKFDGLSGLILSVEMGNSEIIAYSVNKLQEKPQIEKPVFEKETYTFVEAINGFEKTADYPKKPSDILKNTQQEQQKIQTTTRIYTY